MSFINWHPPVSHWQCEYWKLLGINAGLGLRQTLSLSEESLAHNGWKEMACSFWQVWQMLMSGAELSYCSTKIFSKDWKGCLHQERSCSITHFLVHLKSRLIFIWLVFLYMCRIGCWPKRRSIQHEHKIQIHQMVVIKAQRQKSRWSVRPPCHLIPQAGWNNPPAPESRGLSEQEGTLKRMLIAF